MVERNQGPKTGRGLLDRLWGRDGRLTPPLLADVLLMAMLADGRLTETKLDALSWSMAHRPELAGLEWDKLLVRASKIAEDAPLFFDLRQRLAASISDPKDRRLALALAARVAGASAPLAEEEQALLRSLAAAFEIGDAEQAELLRRPPPGSPAFTWRRTGYSDPTVPPAPFFEALAHAREPGDVRVLAHRLHALRILLDTRFRDAVLLELGHPLPVDGEHFRIDGILQNDGQAVWAKTLAAGESLHPRERALLPGIKRKSERAGIALCISHSGPLSPPDSLLFEELDDLEILSVQAG